jgi:SIT family siderophore-iron:H+ symporter-like MFS transporter
MEKPLDKKLAVAEEPHAGTNTDPPAEPTPKQQLQTSPGIVRMEAAAAHLTTVERVIFFSSIFVVSYSYGLDQLTRSAYVPYATTSYQNHAMLATINVIRGVVAAAIQPTVTRLSEIFGRIEIFSLAVVLYTLGTVAETFAKNVRTFAGGAIRYQVGYNISTLTIEIMIAEFTSVKT